MTTPDQDPLLAQPVGGDIDKELRAAGKGISKVTIGLAVAVLVVLAFGGGALAHKALATTTTAAPATGGRGAGGYGGFGGGQGGQGGQPGQGGQGRGGTTGTIDHVDGSTVYVKTQDGRVIKVSTSDSTTVDLTSAGKLADLAAGDTVVVLGQQAADGSVTARSLTRRQAAG